MEKYSSSQALTILTILVQVITLATARHCIVGNPITVYIVSYLPRQSPTLQVHCASKEDDLGNHTLGTYQQFMFDFCTNYHNTLFYCDMSWGPKQIHFTAFEAKPFRSGCQDFTCYWAAKDDGLYYSDYNPPRGLLKKFDWS
ncbi:Plant self-incompatibility protein S1 family [Striga hermonthica]|uniref:S-protein homolog n=1 Tax=Striga hermonthica TaxID=68872 RepID=A0A9N7RQW5_STRHE|nr:Plant self-incompatibility protein S1 family [Striga hermonthica]